MNFWTINYWVVPNKYPLYKMYTRWAPSRYNLGCNSYKYGYNPQLPSYKAIYRGYNPIYNW